RGIQRLTVLDDLVVLSGAGVGGGSLWYANTLYEPLDPFFEDPQWAGVTDWRAELFPYYERARLMLGANETPFESPADAVIREVARRMGAEDTFRRTTVAVDFDLCVRCGGCMVGCRYGAKNTLDRNYLLLAEQGGARVHAEREATLLRRVDGGWEIETRRSGAWLRPRRELFRAEQVVLAAGVLGTLELLLRSGVGGPNVGSLVRSDSEVILLVMQARDNALNVRWTGRRLRSEHGANEPAPTWIPEANKAARLAAEVMGGLPGSGLNEVLLNRPFTAHILGGAPIGVTPADGVLDGWQRV